MFSRTALVMVVTLGILLARIRLTAIFALAIIDVTVHGHSQKMFRFSGFSGIWKQNIPVFTWPYRTCRDAFRTTVHPSGNVVGCTIASAPIWRGAVFAGAKFIFLALGAAVTASSCNSGFDRAFFRLGFDSVP